MLLSTYLPVVYAIVFWGCTGISNETLSPDKILQKGDKFPRTDINEILALRWTGSGLDINYRDNTTHGRAYPANIYFPVKGASIKLKENGTTYRCTTEGGCRVGLEDFRIIEGVIEVYYDKSNEAADGK